VLTTILLARHGETDWNRTGRFQGHADQPLNEHGREQARDLAEALSGEPIAAVYASDLRRAAETAAIVADRLGVPLTLRRELREVDVGEFSGLTRDEIDARWPEAQRRHEERGYGWLEGESLDEMSSRVRIGLLKIAREHPDELVLAVGHGGTVRATLALVDGLDVISHRRVVDPAANGSWVRIGIRDGELVRVD
jgi:broad specificity phosphatase PhoE